MLSFHVTYGVTKCGRRLARTYVCMEAMVDISFFSHHDSCPPSPPSSPSPSLFTYSESTSRVLYQYSAVIFQFNFISHTHMWNNTQVELCHSLSRLTCIVMLHAHTFCPQQSPCSHVHLLVVYFVPSHSLVHRLRLWRCCRRGLLLRFLYHWTFVPPHEELLLCSFFLGQLDE